MKKPLIFPAILLSIMLLSACGKSEEIAPTADVPLSSTEQQESDNESEGIAESENAVSEDNITKEDIETDVISLSISHDVFEGKGIIHSTIGYSGDEKYYGFTTAELLENKRLNEPAFIIIHTIENTIETERDTIWGEMGDRIRKPFEDMYEEYLLPLKPVFDEVYYQFTEEFVDKHVKDYNELHQTIDPIDITSSMPDKLLFVKDDSGTIELPIVSANAIAEYCTIMKNTKEIYEPFWDDGEDNHAFTGILVKIMVPKESLDELRAYNYGRYYTDSEESDSEIEAADAPSIIPDGKNFDNVTGFEGYWYDTKSDKLIYVLFSDGTGLEISDIDGTAYDIKYTAKNGMVTISESLDTYFLDIIDENTLRADWDIVRKPYDGSLDKKTDSQKSEKPAENSVSDITGLWYDPSGYQTSVYNFNGDGTGALYWNGNTGDASSFTYTISGSRVSLSFSNHSEGFTISGGSLLSDYGDEFVRK